MTRCAVLIALLLSIYQIQAQETLLKKDVRKQTLRNEKPDFGPNGTNYFTNVLGYSFILPLHESDSLRTRNSSGQVIWAMRYKRKLNEYFSLGYDMLYMYQTFRIKQDSAMNLLSPGFENNKQRLSSHNIGIGVYARINFDRRGNYLGKYIDLAGELHYVVGERLFTKNNVDPSTNAGASRVKTNASRLDYTRNIQQYAVARLGWSHVVLSARYRVSDLFNASQNINAGMKLPELSRLSIGLEILIPDSSSKTDDFEEID